MSQDPTSLADFSGTARLFPLPNLVLFPYVIQPLHVFEPRYRQMMEDALAGDRLLAMALLKPGWEGHYEKAPPIHPVVCLGKIFKEERLADGRYNLLLHGLCRARILEELKTDKLYRSARVELLRDVPPGGVGGEQDLRRQLGQGLGRWLAAHSLALEQLRQVLQSNLPIGTLCDVFTFALALDVEVKQQLLGEVDVERRARLLLDRLQTAEAPAASELPRRKFPPEFSPN
jgi:Lon protease-like protein